MFTAVCSAALLAYISCWLTPRTQTEPQIRFSYTLHQMCTGRYLLGLGGGLFAQRLVRPSIVAKLLLICVRLWELNSATFTKEGRCCYSKVLHTCTTHTPGWELSLHWYAVHYWGGGGVTWFSWSNVFPKDNYLLAVMQLSNFKVTNKTLKEMGLELVLSKLL